MLKDSTKQGNLNLDTTSLSEKLTTLAIFWALYCSNFKLYNGVTVEPSVFFIKINKLLAQTPSK